MRVSFLSVSRRFSRASTASAKRASRSAACEMRTQFAHLPQKSGSPSVVSGRRQFMVFASMSASVYLPAPVGPARVIAWGKCPRASMSRRRWTISAFPWKSENGTNLNLPRTGLLGFDYPAWVFFVEFSLARLNSLDKHLLSCPRLFALIRSACRVARRSIQVAQYRIDPDVGIVYVRSRYLPAIHLL